MPVPHTQATLDRTNMATVLLADNTWATNGLPSQEKSRTLRHHHITERLKVIFAFVTLTHTARALKGPLQYSSPVSTTHPTSPKLPTSCYAYKPPLVSEPTLAQHTALPPQEPTKKTIPTICLPKHTRGSRTWKTNLRIWRRIRT
jgi:hypothetical protein